ncbi:acyl-CoA dehydrogenase family protein [Sphingopyxis granuli]|jgi:alkylation response protein AidB-like acyl-CoA dehydrogenase|uniref:acyl-CoA dehydrogenase family protein n=1 Tax=Sphingopyxis granuli TaxID=267128 RepID=UPI001BB02FDD|nr:acyl-CoA dehydrogenase family protein [Sphingopyxis granuli]QUM74424.1 acyl-CoA dehydrogenase family protein [Sphingopyxis granuli]
MADYDMSRDSGTKFGLLQRVRAVIDEIASRAELCEEQRVVPVENMIALRDAGFLGGFKPAQYGGGEIDPGEMLEAASEIASVCASTAWVAQLLAVHSHAISYYDTRLQEEVWGADRHALIGSSVAPVGKVEHVEGGYRLTGRYSFSSGCDHASWILFGGYLPGPNGEKLHSLFVVPRSDYEIVDNWHTMALRGTGSKDVILNNVFVPDYRAETFQALGDGTARGYGTHKADIFTLPFQSIFASGFSAVSFGIARAALAHYKERMEKRVRAYTGAQVSASPPAFMHLAAAHNEMLAAQAILHREWNVLDAVASSRQPPDMDTVIRWRTVLPYVTKLSMSIVDRLITASGGGAIMQSSPLQRCFRDMHGAAAHAVNDYDIATQILGRHLIGAQPDPNLL